MGTYVSSFLRWAGWRDLVARLPLPMLALAASFGVYRFALMFVPAWVAVVQAAAFEGVYIGLAVVQLDTGQRQRAQAISIGAVIVSMLYNTLDGLFHLRPELLTTPPLWLDITLAALHGIPLAALAYLVSDLLLHHTPKFSAKSLGDSAPATVPNEQPDVVKRNGGGRPALYTLDGLMLALDGEMAFTRDQARQRLGCSETVVDRLLGEAVERSLIEKATGRGAYRIRDSHIR